MNSLKETNFIKNQNNEEAKISPNLRKHTVNYVSSKDDIILSKSIFYACNNCNGALIPASSCIFCKRSAMRTCTNCGMMVDTLYHESCKILMIFGNTISKKYSTNY